MNKAEFLQTLRARRARLEANLQRASEAQLVHRATPDAWSIKDGLAHLTFYEQHMLKQVRLALNKELEISPVTEAERVARNARIFTQNRDRSLVDVLTEMGRSFAEVVALVATIPEPVLTNPQYFPSWLNGMPLWEYILDETSGDHYVEHLGTFMDESAVMQ